LPDIDYLFWIILIATLAAIYAAIRGFRKDSVNEFGEYGNGILGISTMVAFVVAAWLYYLEGRDRPKVNVTASGTVIGIAPRGRGPNQPVQEVLIQIAINIDNRGERGQRFNCAALDIIALEGTEERVGTFPDDLAGNSLLEINALAPADPVWTNCTGNGGFEQKRAKREREEQGRRQGASDVVNPSIVTGTPASGARYRDFYMEPGERTTRTWEQRVSCRYNAVRVIFKLPKPGETSDYEAKLLIPIADVCRGEQLVATVEAADPD
jgi:hypothetical protein